MVLKRIVFWTGAVALLLLVASVAMLGAPPVR